MKKQLLALSAVTALLVGCAGPAQVVPGFLYTDMQGPAQATSNKLGSKVGTATCTSILGLVANGDCSIEAAAKAGSVSTVTHVDTKTTNLLGFYATYTTTVRGN